MIEQLADQMHAGTKLMMARPDGKPPALFVYKRKEDMNKEIHSIH